MSSSSSSLCIGSSSSMASSALPASKSDQPLPYCPFNFIEARSSIPGARLTDDHFHDLVQPCLDEIDVARCRSVCTAFYVRMWHRPPTLSASCPKGLLIVKPSNRAFPSLSIIPPRGGIQHCWKIIAAIFDDLFKEGSSPEVLALRENFERADREKIIPNIPRKLYAIVAGLQGPQHTTEEKKEFLLSFAHALGTIFKSCDSPASLADKMNDCMGIYLSCIFDKQAFKLFQKFGPKTAELFYILNHRQSWWKKLFLCHQSDASPFGQACAAMEEQWGLQKYKPRNLSSPPTFTHIGPVSKYSKYLAATNNILFQTFALSRHLKPLEDYGDVIDEILSKLPGSEAERLRSYSDVVLNYDWEQENQNPVALKNLFQFTSILMEHLGFTTRVERSQLTLAQLAARVQSQPEFHRSIEHGTSALHPYPYPLSFTSDVEPFISALIISILSSKSEIEQDFDIFPILRDSPLFSSLRQAAFQVTQRHFVRVGLIRTLLEQHAPTEFLAGIDSVAPMHDAFNVALSLFPTWVHMDEEDLSPAIEAYVLTALQANNASMLQDLKGAWQNLEVALEVIRTSLQKPIPTVPPPAETTLIPDLTLNELRISISIAQILTVLRTPNLPQPIIQDLLNGLDGLSLIQDDIQTNFKEMFETKAGAGGVFAEPATKQGRH